MGKIKSILCYTWAIMIIPIALAIIFSSPVIYSIVFGDEGVKVTNWISGGKIMHVINRNDYSIYLHKPVFDGFFYERKSGYIQIDFISQTNLPRNIEEVIDYNLDKKPDFNFSLNTQSNLYHFDTINNKVKHLTKEEVYILENRRTIRVNIEK